MNSGCLYRATRDKQKTEIFLVTRFLFLVSTNGQTRDKREFAAKFVGIIVTIFFVKKNSQIPFEIFPTDCFFTGHLKKSKETTFRTSSPNPRQLCAHQSKSFPTVLIIFWGFKDFLIYLSKYFWSLLNSPYLIFQLLFCKNNVSKSF